MTDFYSYFLLFKRVSCVTKHAANKLLPLWRQTSASVSCSQTSTASPDCKTQNSTLASNAEDDEKCFSLSEELRCLLDIFLLIVISDNDVCAARLQFMLAGLNRKNDMSCKSENQLSQTENLMRQHVERTCPNSSSSMVNLKSKSVGSFSKIHIKELKYSLSWKDNKQI